MVIVVHNMKYGAKILYIYDIHKFCNHFLNKFEKKSQQLGNRMRKVEDACGLGFGETVYLIFFHSCDCCFK